MSSLDTKTAVYSQMGAKLNPKRIQFCTTEFTRQQGGILHFTNVNYKSIESDTGQEQHLLLPFIILNDLCY